MKFYPIYTLLAAALLLPCAGMAEDVAAGTECEAGQSFYKEVQPSVKGSLRKLVADILQNGKPVQVYISVGPEADNGGFCRFVRIGAPRAYLGTVSPEAFKELLDCPEYVSEGEETPDYWMRLYLVQEGGKRLHVDFCPAPQPGMAFHGEGAPCEPYTPAFYLPKLHAAVWGLLQERFGIEQRLDSPTEHVSSPLFEAVADDDDVLVRKLLAEGADTRQRMDDRGCTPVEHAASHGCAAALRALLAAGVAADAPDADGRTPLMYAAANLQAECMKVLLEAGAKTGTVAKDGETLLMAAAGAEWLGREKAVAEVFRMLSSAKVDVNARDIAGDTALLRAIRASNTEFVKLLLQAGADANAAGDAGKTPLIAACQYRATPEVVSMLLQAGADVSAQDAKGETALSYAEKVCQTARRIEHPSLDTYLETLRLVKAAHQAAGASH